LGEKWNFFYLIELRRKKTFLFYLLFVLSGKIFYLRKNKIHFYIMYFMKENNKKNIRNFIKNFQTKSCFNNNFLTFFFSDQFPKLSNYFSLILLTRSVLYCVKRIIFIKL
jgi:hypothetical protein